MQRSTKYVALDVHQATTVAAVRAEHGRVIARAVLPTEAAAVTLARKLAAITLRLWKTGERFDPTQVTQQAR